MSADTYVNGFHQFSRQSYYELLKDQVDRIEEFNVGLYACENGKSSGGTKGEFSISWKMLSNEIVASVRIFDDAWHLMGQPMYQELFTSLSSLGTSVKPADVLKILLACGFVDISQNSIQVEAIKEDVAV